MFVKTHSCGSGTNITKYHQYTPANKHGYQSIVKVSLKFFLTFNVAQYETVNPDVCITEDMCFFEDVVYNSTSKQLAPDNFCTDRFWAVG
jgi:hypothetical protein